MNAAGGIRTDGAVKPSDVTGLEAEPRVDTSGDPPGRPGVRGGREARPAIR